ncbi:MAG: hypothetical protein IPK17_06890 [Chloroflexi bacterium]|uniref:hypothetical protein n=1 Tax=Candidatus Flexifilum breve TaxID=3140694 RepID=UPI00313580EB|nr:hypothetical protein [Chloroflexota bacterium]
MRLNRSTIIFIVALLAFIVVVLLLNQNQATAPGDTTVTPTSAPVALLPGVDNTTLARLEVRDNTTGERIVLTKATADGAWLYDNTTRAEPGVETEVSGTQQADPTVLSALIPLLTNLNSADSFEDANLANFGLTSPLYTVLATTYDGAVFLVHIGGQSRVNPRYYVIVEQAGSANVGGTEEPQAIGTQEIGAADATAEEASGRWRITRKDLAGSQRGQAVSRANIEATNAAVGTQVAQANATAEAAAAAVTAEASAEPQAIGTQEIQPADATAEATVEATVEATPEALPTIEPTLAPLAEPLVALEGTFRIYVVQKSTLDRFINLITTPPVFVPTPTPTTDLGLLSIPSTDVPQGSLSTPEVTLDVTAEATTAP